MASLSRGCKLRITVVPTAVEDDCYANIFVRGGDGGGQTSCIMGDVVVANAKKFSGSKTVTENTISNVTHITGILATKSGLKEFCP